MNSVQYVEEGNQCAHKSFSETALCIAEYPESQDKWGQAFEFTYGMSIDEAVKESLRQSI